MKKTINKTHLSESDRCKILMGIEKGDSFKAIAIEIGCCSSTVSREIKKHIQIERKGTFGKRFNDCKHKTNCPVQMAGECNFRKDCTRVSCYNCSFICNPNTCSYYDKVT